MDREKAIRYINIYLNDYCTDKQIEDNWKIHTRFVKEMLLSIREQLEG